MSFLKVLIVLNFSSSPLNQLYNPASPLINETNKLLMVSFYVWLSHFKHFRNKIILSQLWKLFHLDANLNSPN